MTASIPRAGISKQSTKKSDLLHGFECPEASSRMSHFLCSEICSVRTALDWFPPALPHIFVNHNDQSFDQVKSPSTQHGREGGGGGRQEAEGWGGGGGVI